MLYYDIGSIKNLDLFIYILIMLITKTDNDKLLIMITNMPYKLHVKERLISPRFLPWLL